jgi:phenylacetate-coenzyme A ligase PaaK-like adenylate-forming protein
MLLNEARSPAALLASQNRQLRSLLRQAGARVPFYRDLYAAHGITIGSFRGLSDLSTLPIVDKRLMRAAGAAGRLSAQQCSCGLPFPLLAVIEGRANDLLAFADGRTGGPSGALVLMIQFADAIIQYQLRLLAIGHFELFIVPSSRFAQVGQERIVNALRTELGAATIEVRLSMRSCRIHPASCGHLYRS